MFGEVCEVSGDCTILPVKVQVTCDDSESYCKLSGELLQTNEEDGSNFSSVTEVCKDDADIISVRSHIC